METVYFTLARDRYPPLSGKWGYSLHNDFEQEAKAIGAIVLNYGWHTSVLVTGGNDYSMTLEDSLRTL